jgi:protocatechuate 3,4-dioxygenase alpha subunit
VTTTADGRDGAATASSGQLVPTPRTILGPYFTLGMRVRPALQPAGHQVPITVSGRVLNGLGEPVMMTMVETSQPEGWTRYFTGLDGAYEITTVKPQATPGRAPHLLLLVMSGNFMIRPAVTCLYFPDEDNDTDELLQQLSPEQRATMFARRTDVGYEFDIHLAGDSETTFLGWPGLLDDEE